MIKLTCSCGSSIETNEDIPLITICEFQSQHKECIDTRLIPSPVTKEALQYLEPYLLQNTD